jgi:hemoglobin
MRSSLRPFLAVSLAALLLHPAGAAAQTVTEETESEPRPAPLFERAGGTYVLAQVVDDFVDGMLADPVIRANAAVRQAAKPSRRAGLKFQITSLLCQETGGPCKYEGQTMRETHQSMDISDREWGVMVWTFKRALARADVPAAEREELMNVLQTTKGDIVLSRRK